MFDRWRELTLVRLLFPFIAGILLASKLSLPETVLLAIITLLLAIFVMSFFIQRAEWVIKMQAPLGVLLMIKIACLGALTYANFSERSLIKPASQEAQEAIVVVRSISRPEGGKYIKLKTDLLNFVHHDSIRPARGKLLLRLKSKDEQVKLMRGDRLLIPADFDTIKARKQLAGFDIAQFYHRKGIHFQRNLKPRELKVIGSKEPSALDRFAELLRNKATEQFENYIPHADSRAVLSAILLGNKDLLDDEIRSSYSATGAMHVLAVSGLHVGLLYLILFRCLKFLGNTTKISIARALFLLSVIWFYAFLTGFSSSVLRAATMFSFISLASNSRSYTNIYNVIAASALLLLLLNPLLVYDLGFQLSYAAITAIILLQPKFAALFASKATLPTKAWEIVSASTAAQTGTLPMNFYYFNQFPLVFPLTNLLIIPAAFVIYSGGLLFLSLSPIESLAWLSGLLLSWIIHLVNLAIQALETFPYANVEGIAISFFETAVLYLAIIFAAAYWYNKKSVYLLAASFGFIAFSGYDLHENWQIHRSEYLVIHADYGGTGIEHYQAGKSRAYFDFDLYSDFEKRERLTRDLHRNHDITNATFHILPEYGTVDSILFARPSSLDESVPPKPLKVDWLFIGKNLKSDYSQIEKHFEFQFLILEASLYRKQHEELTHLAAQLCWNTIDLKSEGSQLIKIR